MEATLSEIKLKLLRLLADTPAENEYGEPIGGTTYNADLLKDSIHAALDALCVRYWKEAVSIIDSIEESATVFELPADLLEIEGVFDATIGKTVPKILLQPSEQLAAITGDNAWLDYPAGSITFFTELTDKGATIYYSAMWAKPGDDDDTLEPPEIATTAILMYAASYCLLQSANNAANIRQFATKVDAGAPTDNPLADMATFFLKRFEYELMRLPAKTKGIQS